MKNLTLKGMTAATLVIAGTFVGNAWGTPTQFSVQADGWNITYPAGVTVTPVGGSPSTLELTQTIVMNSDEGTIVAFNQIAADAASTIVLNSDSVSNQTGSDWSGVEFVIANPLGTNNGGQFDPAGGFTDIAPFTTTTLGTEMVSYSGGVLPDGSTVNFSNSADGGGLTIDVATGLGDADFSIKQTPLMGGGSAIPLPAAIWSSLSVVGLGLFGVMARRMRKGRYSSGRGAYRTSAGGGRIWPV